MIKSMTGFGRCEYAKGERRFVVEMKGVLAGEYLRYFHEMEESFGLENDIRVSTLSRCPEVLTMEEQAVDEEELWNELKQALDGAISQFVETRGTEGENLKKDLIEKLDGMVKLADKIEERSEDGD